MNPIEKNKNTNVRFVHIYSNDAHVPIVSCCSCFVTMRELKMRLFEGTLLNAYQLILDGACFVCYFQ